MDFEFIGRVPDYRRRAVDVYQLATRHSIITQNNTDFLYTEKHPTKRLAGLPSWVVDWSNSAVSATGLVNNIALCRPRLRASLNERCLSSGADDVLTMSGYSIDTISTVTRTSVVPVGHQGFWRLLEEPVLFRRMVNTGPNQFMTVGDSGAILNVGLSVIDIRDEWDTFAQRKHRTGNCLGSKTSLEAYVQCLTCDGDMVLARKSDRMPWMATDISGNSRWLNDVCFDSRRDGPDSWPHHVPSCRR